MKKIFCLNKISNVGQSVLPMDTYQLTESIEEASAILVRSADMHLMDIPPQIEAIARAGAGVNNIPYEALAKKGIVVFNTPGANANAVAELTLAGMLLAVRDIHGGINWVKQNQTDPDIAKTTEKAKSKFAGTELLGKSIGIIGLGAIGLRIAALANGFGMKVYGNTLNHDELVLIKDSLPPIEFIRNVEEMYPHCDFISLNLPYSAEAKHMINKNSIARMKDGVIILNFARDGLVHEEDLLNAMTQNKVRKYVTDFPNANNATIDQFLVVPHLGASTEEAEDNCASMAANQVRNFLEHGNIKNSVNFPNLDAGPKTKKSRITVMYEADGAQFEMMEKITSYSTSIHSFIHAERNGLGYGIIDCDHEPDQVTLDAIFELKGVIRVRKV